MVFDVLRKQYVYLMKKLPWRVRVKLTLETWVDIEAPNAGIAEVEAAKLPNVISLYLGYRLPERIK